MAVTQSALVQAMRREVVPIHRHWLEGGCMHMKAPHTIDGDTVVAEIDQMMHGDEEAAYYLAYQPLLNGVDHGKGGTEEAPEMVCENEELLLRAKDATQNFPAAVAYHLPSAKRQEFCMWQNLKAVERANVTGRCQQINWWEQDLEIWVNVVISVSRMQSQLLFIHTFLSYPFSNPLRKNKKLCCSHVRKRNLGLQREECED